MSRLIVCSAAESDYTESLIWYAKQNTDLGREFDAEINRALSEIANDPERFPHCDPHHRYFLTRRFPFQVIYRVEPEQIVVMAIAHASRSPEYWKDR